MPTSEQSYQLASWVAPASHLPLYPKHPKGRMGIERYEIDPITGQYIKTTITSQPGVDGERHFDLKNLKPGDCIKIMSMDADAAGKVVQSDAYGVIRSIVGGQLDVTWTGSAAEMAEYSKQFIENLVTAGAIPSLMRIYKRIDDEITRLVSLRDEVKAQMKLANSAHQTVVEEVTGIPAPVDPQPTQIVPGDSQTTPSTVDSVPTPNAVSPAPTPEAAQDSAQVTPSAPSPATIGPIAYDPDPNAAGGASSVVTAPVTPVASAGITNTDADDEDEELTPEEMEAMKRLAGRA